MTTIQPNAHVTVDYVLRDAKGRVLDESQGDGGEPIRYVHGYGMLVPGLEAGIGMYDIADQRPPVLQPYAGGHAPLPGAGRETILRLGYEHAL